MRRITAETIRRMHDLAKKAKTNWDWISLNSFIIRNLPSKVYFREARRIFEVWHALIWRANFLRYVRDPNGVELVTSVWHILDRGMGDCDDFSVLIASAVGTQGFPYRFKTIAANPERPDVPNHVYVEVNVAMDRDREHWVPMDLTVKSAGFGWEPRDGELPSQVYPEPRY